MNADYPLTLFYDAACPVCALEMDALRARTRDGRLVFVDISTPGFDAGAYGLTHADVDAEVHALRPDGSIVRGMAVLRLAYAAAGLGWALRPTGWVPMRPLFDAGYSVFARHRRAISRVAAPLVAQVRAARARRVTARMGECAAAAAGACRLRETGSGSRS